MAITDKTQGVWNTDEVYNKINQSDWLTYDAEIKTQQRWFLSTSAYLAKLDAKEAKENRTDSVGRKVDAEGRVKFKTAP